VSAPRRLAGLLSVFLALTAPRVGGAQAVVRVLDTDSLPVPYALVSVRGGTERLADSLGIARLSISVEDAAHLAVRRLGFAPFTGITTRNAGGEFVVRLERMQHALEEVRTVAARNSPLARSGFYERMQRVQDGAITGTFLTPEELDRRNPTYLSEVLQGVTSVRIRRTHDGSAFAMGRGDCAMEVLVDGMRINGLQRFVQRPGNRSGSPGGLHLDQLAHGREIAAIEVYGSSANAPAELVPLTGRGGCGLIAVWTGGRN
jgi:hypothetical protein